jgi:D-tyrosyl-tRNA(Tyr) deacylase
VRAVVQRIASASVAVGDRTAGAIRPGLLAFVGVEQGDGADDVRYIAEKIHGLRVFEDPADPSHHMTRSVADVNGATGEFQAMMKAECKQL